METMDLLNKYIAEKLEIGSTYHSVNGNGYYKPIYFGNDFVLFIKSVDKWFEVIKIHNVDIPIYEFTQEFDCNYVYETLTFDNLNGCYD